MSKSLVGALDSERRRPSHVAGSMGAAEGFLISGTVEFISRGRRTEQPTPSVLPSGTTWAEPLVHQFPAALPLACARLPSVVRICEILSCVLCTRYNLTGFPFEVNVLSSTHMRAARDDGHHIKAFFLICYLPTQILHRIKRLFQGRRAYHIKPKETYLFNDDGGKEDKSDWTMGLFGDICANK